MRSDSMNKYASIPDGSEAGFTLVEVCLALMVIGVGMLAVLSLFPAGLQMGGDASADLYAGRFADEVFNGYRSYFVQNQSYWNNPNSLIVTTVVSAIWGSSKVGDLGTRVTGSGIRTNVYKGSGITHYAVRYRLNIEPDGPRLNYAKLEVWNGEFGPPDAPADNVFYTEYYDYGL